MYSTKSFSTVQCRPMSSSTVECHPLRCNIVHYSTMSSLQYNVAPTVQCCPYSTMSSLQYNVVSTVQCRKMSSTTAKCRLLQCNVIPTVQWRPYCTMSFSTVQYPPLQQNGVYYSTMQSQFRNFLDNFNNNIFRIYLLFFLIWVFYQIVSF